MRDVANLYRRLVFGGVILLCLAPIEGELAHLVGGLAVLGSLILYLVQGLGTLRLNISWHIGYLTIIVSEGIRYGDIIRSAVDAEAYNEASRYITAANAAAMLVRSLLFDEREPEPIDVRPVAPKDGPRLTLFAVVAQLLFLAAFVPDIIVSSQSARSDLDSGATRSASTAISGGLIYSLGVILPAIMVYYARYSRKMSANAGMLLALPPIIALYLVGVRFVVLMAAAGAFVIYAPSLKSRKVPFLRFTVLGIILYIAASTMAVFRVAGIANTSWSMFEEYYSENYGMHVEGVVVVLAKMMNYLRHHDLLLGRSSATILFFWIPRQFWAGKPTFIDHWFIREYEGTSGFNEGFSTGSTFASDALVDFGFYGGIVFCGIFFGSLLAFGDRLCVRILSRRGHPFTVVIAPLFGGILFAVRSFNTTVVQMIGVLVVGMLFVAICDRPVPVKQVSSSSSGAPELPKEREAPAPSQ